jgi:hypothetical protein
MRTVAALVGLLLLVPVVGCGGPSIEERERAAAEKRAAQLERQRAKQEARQRAMFEACSNELAGLQDALSEVDSRLSVGLNYESYSTAVADVRVAYDRVDFDALGEGGLDCLGKVAVRLERALNQYVDAYEVWNRCFEDFDCDVDSVQPQMQAHWAKATLAIEAADRALERIAPG